MSFFDELFGRTPEPVPTATPVTKAKPNPAAPVTTLTPTIKIATATPPAPAPRIYNDPLWREALSNQETGYNKTQEQRNNAIGDDTKAVGPYQQWPVNVANANEAADKLQRQEVQKWAKEKGFTIGGKEYKAKLESVIPHYKFTNKDRTDPNKAEAMFQINMNALYNQFVLKHGRPPNAIEAAGLHNAGTLSGLTTNTRTPEYMKEFAIKYEEVKKKKK
jgi:hypothetical protein